MQISEALLLLKKEDLIVLGAIGGMCGVIVLVVSVRESFRRWKLKKKFQQIQKMIDPGSTIGPGPIIGGRFRGRELDGYRRNELVGLTLRGGTNPKTIIEFSCLSAVQFTSFTLPAFPLLAEWLHLDSPRIALGDARVDGSFGFASPDQDYLRVWMAKADNKTALITFLSALPPSRRQRFRLWAAGKLQLNMPEYLFFKMSPDRIRQLLEGLNSLAGRLEG